MKITDKRKFPRPMTRVLSEREVFADWYDELYEDVSARVEKGMAWLDEHKPDWFDKFSSQGFEVFKDAKGHQKLAAESFDITCATYCVLGITYGDYNQACKQEGLTLNGSAALGFNLFHDRDWNMDDDDPTPTNVVDSASWGDLQRMWTYKVEKELGIERVVIENPL